MKAALACAWEYSNRWHTIEIQSVNDKTLYVIRAQEECDVECKDWLKKRKKK